MTLSLQALLLGFGAGQICVGVEHTHGGKAAPDCPMHHAGDPQPGHDTSGHAHHGHHGAVDPAETPDFFTCGCAGDALPIYVGPPALLPHSAPLSPLFLIAPLAPTVEVSTPDDWFPPLAPPPRPSRFPVS